MREPEDEDGALRARVEPEPAKSAEILERLVDDGEPDDRVDDIGVHVEAAEHAEEKRRAVSDREQGDVQRHVLQPVQEEDDAGEKQQMVVPRHHVLRAEVQVRADMRAGGPQEKRLVVAGNAVREHARGGRDTEKQRTRRELAAERPVFVPHGGRLYRKVWKNASASGLDSWRPTPNSC